MFASHRSYDIQSSQRGLDILCAQRDLDKELTREYIAKYKLKIRKLLKLNSYCSKWIEWNELSII